MMLLKSWAMASGSAANASPSCVCWGSGAIRSARKLSARRRLGAWAQMGAAKAIAATRDIDHVADARLPVAEHLAKGSDMEAQAALIHHETRPNPREQLSLADDFGRTFDQRDENVERATPQLEPDTVPLEESLRRTESEMADAMT